MTGTEAASGTLTARRPGPAALAMGQVWHRRNQPAVHDFSYPVKQVWLDPDRPEDLFGAHRLGSRRGPRPIRFRARDYLNGDGRAFGPTLRDELEPVLGTRPTGAIRVLTQPRTWGWLFNPITIYLVWPGQSPRDSSRGSEVGEPPGTVQNGPCGAVLEVTNTPWKERHRYAVSLDGNGCTLRTRFDKKLHVSPFLDEDYRYLLTVNMRPGNKPEAHRTIEVGLDVLPASTDDNDRVDPVVETRLRVQLLPPTRRNMTTMVLQNPFPTHRVSLGIHWQAARLATKRVPFIAHPGKRS